MSRDCAAAGTWWGIAPFYTSTADFTIACWAYLRAISQANVQIISNGLNAGNGYALFWPYVNSVVIYTDQAVAYRGSGWAEPANQWCHIGATRSGSGNVTLYGNGSAIESVAVGPSTPGSCWAVGGGTNTGYTANCSLAEAALWSVGLTALEMQSLAKGTPAHRVRPTSLQAYSPMWGLSNPEPDFSGKAHPLTLQAGSSPRGTSGDPPVASHVPLYAA